MNTNQLKKFAQAARLKLLEQVGARLNYVLNNDTAELRGKANTLKKLQTAVEKQGAAAIIDKVAYTWFNRLVALRFMDANRFQPIGISVLTPANTANSVSPELLDAAHGANIPEELQVDRQHILDLLDGRINSSNPDNDVFRILLVAACNQLHSAIPFLFERIDDYTELLLPDDLTSPFSIVKDVVQGMSDGDCSNVEIIGWLYQFYISEKKDEVFASKSAVKKEDIPAATQLFTPRWIVEYMVQNTVGKLWLQNKPNSRLKEHMPYFIDSPSLNADEFLKVVSVEEIKLLDQASGSGHILVYGFELLYKIYEEEGYNPNDIPALIIKNNLYGFEIDERAAQLSGFALLMKARGFYRRFFRNPIKPNILCYEDLTLSLEELKETFDQLGIKPSDDLLFDLGTLKEATNYGSLISPKTELTALEKVKTLILSKENGSDAFLQYRQEELLKAINQLITLGQKYHCVVDNPPYMGGGNMNKTLGAYVKIHYPDSKADLMACFMEAGLKVLHPHGFLGMINQHSWMFLSSYEDLRKKLIETTFFDTLLHLGPRTFPEIGGEVVQNAAFTFWNATSSEYGIYLRLVDFLSTESKRDHLTQLIRESSPKLLYRTNQDYFKKINGNPICYWTSNTFYESFSKYKILDDYCFIDGKNVTANNDKYIRMHWEIKQSERFDKYIPIAKGGDFRKWMGNTMHLVDWSDQAKNDYRSTNSGRLIQSYLWFKEGLTFSRMSKVVNCRKIDSRGTFDGTTLSFFFRQENTESLMIWIQAFFNSKVGDYYVKVLNPKLVFQFIDIKKIPIAFPSEINIELVKQCNKTSLEEWDFKEYSLDFKTNQIIGYDTKEVQESYDLFQQYWRTKFFQLHKNEEELNKQFIEIYGLQDELTPDVPLEEITILKEETKIENGELVFHADEVFAQFVSYAVGCMFGRYSLDKEGLILANQGESLKEYLIKVEKSQTELSFLPDEDNAIPVLDDEWFEDDIVARFHDFLKVSFGEKKFQKNLAFVEECLGKDIRKYFVKDFYKDHVRRYKKRPIYWMFSSPKGYFNVLIYMHRYTPDTLSTILNGYLREFIGKLELQRKQQEHTVVYGSPTEQNKARKEVDKIDEMLADCRKYESEILYPMAGERISIDLDDGVLVNYNKFGAAIAPVEGLNDKKTKKKVMEFDWIDNKQIR